MTNFDADRFCRILAQEASDAVIYADAKGFTTDMARMRYRLLKHQLAEKGEFDSQIKFIVFFLYKGVSFRLRR